METSDPRIRSQNTLNQQKDEFIRDFNDRGNARAIKYEQYVQRANTILQGGLVGPQQQKELYRVQNDAVDTAGKRCFRLVDIKSGYALLPLEEVFELIKKYHLQLNHAAATGLYKHIKEHEQFPSGNISIEMVKDFVHERCPSCKERNEQRRQQKEQRQQLQQEHIPAEPTPPPLQMNDSVGSAADNYNQFESYINHRAQQKVIGTATVSAVRIGDDANHFSPVCAQMRNFDPINNWMPKFPPITSTPVQPRVTAAPGIFMAACSSSTTGGVNQHNGSPGFELNYKFVDYMNNSDSQANFDLSNLSLLNEETGSGSSNSSGGSASSARAVDLGSGQLHRAEKTAAEILAGMKRKKQQEMAGMVDNTAKQGGGSTVQKEPTIGQQKLVPTSILKKRGHEQTHKHGDTAQQKVVADRNTTGHSGTGQQNQPNSRERERHDGQQRVAQWNQMQPQQHHSNAELFGKRIVFRNNLLQEPEFLPYLVRLKDSRFGGWKLVESAEKNAGRYFFFNKALERQNPKHASRWEEPPEWIEQLKRVLPEPLRKRLTEEEEELDREEAASPEPEATVLEESVLLNQSAGAAASSQQPNRHGTGNGQGAGNDESSISLRPFNDTNEVMDMIFPVPAAAGQQQQQPFQNEQPQQQQQDIADGVGVQGAEEDVLLDAGGGADAFADLDMDIGDDLGAFVEDFDDGLAADGDQAQQEPGAREELGATFDDVLNNFIQNQAQNIDNIVNGGEAAAEGIEGDLDDDADQLDVGGPPDAADFTAIAAAGADNSEEELFNLSDIPLPLKLFNLNDIPLPLMAEIRQQQPEPQMDIDDGGRPGVGLAAQAERTKPDDNGNNCEVQSSPDSLSAREPPKRVLSADRRQNVVIVSNSTVEVQSSPESDTIGEANVLSKKNLQPQQKQQSSNSDHVQSSSSSMSAQTGTNNSSSSRPLAGLYLMRQQSQSIKSLKFKPPTFVQNKGSSSTLTAQNNSQQPQQPQIGLEKQQKQQQQQQRVLKPLSIPHLPHQPQQPLGSGEAEKKKRHTAKKTAVSSFPSRARTAELEVQSSPAESAEEDEDVGPRPPPVGRIPGKRADILLPVLSVRDYLQEHPEDCTLAKLAKEEEVTRRRSFASVSSNNESKPVRARVPHKRLKLEVYSSASESEEEEEEEETEYEIDHDTPCTSADLSKRWRKVKKTNKHTNGDGKRKKKKSSRTLRARVKKEMSSPPSRVSRSMFDSSTASKQRHRSSGGGRSSSRTHSHSTAADTSQQEFVCVYCPEKVAWDGSNRYFFATEADYRLHLATRHRLIIDETEELRHYLNSQRNESVILLKYLCVICDQTFTEPLEWEEHRQEVHNEEPMDQSFSSIVKEKRSHKRHSHPVKKEEPVEPMDQQQNDDSVFFMDNADVASTSVAVVVADQPKENAPKKNLCEYCGKGFVTEKSMAEHLSTKHLRDIMIKSETEK